MKILKNIKYRILDYICQKRQLTTFNGIPTPKILLIVLLYAASFSLFLAGVKHIQVEQAYAKMKNIQAARRAATPTPEKELYPREKIVSLQNHLAKNILRLHVVADSNTIKDQTLKLEVRNKIIRTLQQTVKKANSPAQAEELITPQIPKLTEIAQETLMRYGSDAPVRITIENRNFPQKTYGDLTFPAGTYRALCVDIGSAKGQNWWCVLFPSLCFIDENTAVVPEESKEKLKEYLTEEEYNALEQTETLSKEKNNPTSTQKPEKAKEKPEIHSALLDFLPLP